MHHAWLGVFKVRVCIIEPVFIEKQQCPRVIDPELLTVPVERGCDPEGCLIVVGCLLHFAIGTICIAKEMVRVAGPKLIAFIQKETDCSGCGIVFKQ